MKHPSHDHALVLNENYIAREGDICRGCSEQIFSSKSLVYSCSCSEGTFVSVSFVFADDRKDLTHVSENVPCALFLLHKSCAELPPQIPNPTNPNEFLQLSLGYSDYHFILAEQYSYGIKHCDICGIQIPWKPKQFFYSDSHIDVCLKCVMFQTQQYLEDPKFKHPAHDHLLSLIQHPSSFRCYACNSDDNIKDMSYRCTKCQFWMHKSCADAPTTFRFQFHDKHPLILSFSLPRVYHKHRQHCRLCNQTLSRLVWLYCCAKCRFFAHFQCARSSQLISSSENEIYDPELLHLPVADELSGYVLGEQLVKAMSMVNNNSTSLFSSTNSIKHWAHPEHFLQLINGNELNNHKDDDRISLLCDGCVKPIRTDNDQFYGCALCKFFLHKFCAELPKEITHHIKPVAASKYREPYKLVYCDGCKVFCNGIFFDFGIIFWVSRKTKFHIGCMTLPILLKHEAHPHKLIKHVVVYGDKYCKACGNDVICGSGHKCEQCYYAICSACAMKARVVKHPWDPHPLHLIYEPGMVMNHEHEFSCEFCSEDIDTNYWFYHCSDCDLSFHLDNCFEKSSYREYSNVKFGATDIIIDNLHPHSLTFVLNKKVRGCKKCHRNQLGEPVLECAVPCKSIFCRSCIEDVTVKQDILTSKV